MPLNFNVDRPDESSLVNSFIKESIQAFGLPIIYYPIYEYDTSVDVIWGEDSLPRYAKGIRLVAYYKYTKPEAIFSKFGLLTEDDIEIYISKDAFVEAFPTTVTSVGFVGPKEGDWFQTTLGHTRYYEVTNYIEGDWNFGRFHCYKLDAKARRYSHEIQNASPGHYNSTVVEISSYTTGTSGTTGEEVKTLLDDSDDFQTEADQVVIEKNRDFWADW